MDNKLLQVLMLFVCVILVVKALPPCSYWDRLRCGRRTCYMVRNRYGYTIPDCLSRQEELLLAAALDGGATGPGTGIGHGVQDRSKLIQLNVNIHNNNTNTHDQSNSGNVDVSQAQASAPSNPNANCVPCGTGGTCVGGMICMFNPACSANLGCLPVPESHLH